MTGRNRGLKLKVLKWASANSVLKLLAVVVWLHVKSKRHVVPSDTLKH